MKRLFIAVNIPTAIKEKVSGSHSLINQPSLKLVKKENLHITLKFIGSVPEEKVNSFPELLARVKAEPFSVILSGFSHFKEKVLFISVKEGSKQLEELARQINEFLGIEDSFHVHLTLARNKSMQEQEFRELVGKLNETGFEESFEVKSVELMESDLKPTGPEYKIVYSHSLSSSTS